MYSGTLRNLEAELREKVKARTMYLEPLKKKAERRGPKLSQGFPAYLSGWESQAESLFMRAEKILVPQRNLIAIQSSLLLFLERK